MEKHKNRIFGVIILLIIGLFLSTINVSAKRGDCPNTYKCTVDGKDYCYGSHSQKNANHYAGKVRKFCKKKANVRNYYDFDIKKTSEEHYRVSVDPDSSYKGKNDVWEITAVNGIESNNGVGKKVSKGDPATVVTAPDNGKVVVTLKLIESKGKYKQCIGTNNADTSVIYHCDKKDEMNHSGTLKVNVSIGDNGEALKGVVKSRDDEMDKAKEEAEAATSESFGNKKDQYEQFDAKTTDDDYIDPNKVDTDLWGSKALKCNVSDKSYYRKNGKYNYTNEHYYWTKGEKKLSAEEKAKRTFNGKQVCTTKCEEQIKVEYGPPAVSIGGFCFEYQVQITSYVHCYSEIDDSTRPKADGYSWCLPPPVNSDHPNDEYRNQAGPNERYEACIKKCDGGKYSQKCSKKCYKEVYGNKSSKEKLALLYSTNKRSSIVSDNKTKNAKNVEDDWNHCKKTDPDGYYSWNGEVGKSGISWHGSYGVGSWYTSTGYSPRRISDEEYVADSDGFCIAHYSNGNYCGDPMKWDADQCKDYTYLDEDKAQEAYDDEVEDWIDAVENCIAATTCNTSTSTYKYHIYSDYNATTKTLLDVFPKLAGQEDKQYGTIDKLEFKKDFLTGNDAYRSTLVNPNPNKASYINDHVEDTAQKINPVEATNDSCYSPENNNTTWYQAAWGLPGRWISNKGGANTYTPQTDLVNYTFEPNKYCLPKNIKDVNQNWWYWNVYDDECQHIDASTKDEYRGTIKDWNIKAYAHNFGAFGWNIQVDCFYATAKVQSHTVSDPTTTSAAAQCPPEGGEHPWNAYIARVINIDNPLNGGLQKKTVDTSNPGRKTGFNWTERAKNEKNDNYIVDPVKLVKKIVEETDTYAKANLEYEFELTTEKIRELKDILKSDGYKGNFTAYNEGTNGHAGKFEHVNGIVAYSSKIVGDFGTRYATIGCNNQKPGSNSASTECENYR